MTAAEALARLRAGESISEEPAEIRSPLEEAEVVEVETTEPAPLDAAMAEGWTTCSPCDGKGGYAGGLKCRTCDGKGQHRLTLPVKWIYTERRRTN
jgi:hypothetical protein